MKTKKLFVLLLAVIMVVAFGTTAFAADDGSITIRNTTQGKTYDIYKVFDLTYSGTGTTKNVAYSYTKTGATDAFYTALTGADSPFTLTATETADKYSVTSDQDAATISAWLTAQKEAGKLSVTGSKTGNGEDLEFSGVPYGYYYITSALGAVVTVDSTLKDVKVVDKNQGPTWDNSDDPNNPVGNGKVIIENGNKVTENTANYGDTVNFSIAVNATAYDGEDLITYYYITDTLNAGFSAHKNIVVKVDGTPLTEDTDYTIVKSGNTFTITLPFGEIYGSDAKIEVTYDATVLNTAVLAGSGNPNTANFTYEKDTTFDPDDPGYDPGDPEDPDYPEPPTNPPTFPSENEKETKTYVYALGFLKVDEEGNKLKGASFSITDANNNAVKAKATGTAGVYEYDSTSTVTEFVTDDNGLLVIKGVKAGTYSVKEVAAPAGYNPLPNPISVEAVLKTAYTTKITTYLDADGKVTKTVTSDKTDTDAGCNVVGEVVVNRAGTELPETGGIGTTIFYVLGGILVIAAAVLLVTRRRMNTGNKTK